MPGPAFIDPEAHDDTELGAEVRNAYAEGARVIALLPIVCPVCTRPVNDCECPEAA